MKSFKLKNILVQLNRTKATKSTKKDASSELAKIAKTKDKISNSSNSFDLNAFIKFTKDNSELNEQLKHAKASKVNTYADDKFQNDTNALLQSLGLSSNQKKSSESIANIKEHNTKITEPKIGKILKADELFAPKAPKTNKKIEITKIDKLEKANKEVIDYQKKPRTLATVITGYAKNTIELEKIINDENKQKETAIVKRYASLLSQIDMDFVTNRLHKYPIFGKDTIDDHAYIYDELDLKLIGNKLIPGTGHKYPSVSNILFLTESDSSRDALKRWKLEKMLKLGVSGFYEYMNQIKEEGSALHTAIEQSLKGIPYDQIKIDSKNELAWSSLKQILQQDLKKSILIESTLAHQSLCYQGRVDAVINYKDTFYIVDWKRSSQQGKRKDRIEDLYDYPLQMCAYLGAYLNDPSFAQTRKQFSVKQTMLVYAYSDGQEPSIHCLSFHQTIFYWIQFLRRLQTFWKIIENNAKTS